MKPDMVRSGGGNVARREARRALAVPVARSKGRDLMPRVLAHSLVKAALLTMN